MAVQLPQHTTPIPFSRDCHNANGAPKRKYANSYAADRIAHKIEEEQCHPMHAYRCPLCGCWHVGHEWDRD